MKYTAENLVSRYQSLKATRTDVEEVWRLSERFIMPLRGEFYQGSDYDGKPNWRLRDIYDGTACDAASSLAANLQGNLVSPSVRWFDLRYQREDQNDDDESKEWLESASDKVFYSLQSSNFNLQVSESFMDLVGLGNAVLVEEFNPKTGDIEFSTVPVREAYFETGYQGGIKLFYRRLDWTAIQVADKFGSENLPDVIREALDPEADPGQRFEIMYAIYPRGGAAIDSTRPADPNILPWGYMYVLVSEREMIGEEGGYYEMPAFVARWRTVSGSDWGHGPGIPVLSSIMTLNQAYQATLESVEKMIEPPIMTTQLGVLGSLDMRRGGVTVVNDINDVGIMPVGGDVNSGIIVIEDLRGQVRRAFFEDQLELKESPAMTATEVNVRYELMQRLLGPTLARLQSDLLDPLIQRTLNILLRTGAIEMPPDAARQGGEVEIEYVGPLPRSQKADQAAAILGWVGQIASLAEVKPELLDIPAWDVVFTKVGNLTGVPATAINSDEEIKDIREKRQAEIEEMKKIESMRATGEAVGALGAGAEAAKAIPPEAIGALQRAVGSRKSI